MKISVLFLMNILFVVLGMAQQELISERPGQALSPNCIGKRSIQVQSGMDLFHFEEKKHGVNLPSSLNTSISSTVVRFGLGNKFEINSGINYGISEQLLASPLVGFKASLFKNQWHDIALQYSTSLHQLNSDPFSNTIKFISSHSFSEKIGLGINTGFNYLPESEGLTVDYVLSIGFNASHKIGIVLENYGNYMSEFKTYWDVGVGYLVAPLFQIDTYFGGNKTRDETDLFLSIGLTYRLDFNEEN